MIYYLLKYLAKIVVKVYFNEVNLMHADKLPMDKPLILAANHQSAFTEPIVLGALAPFPVHFITRGDVFVKRFLWFFKATNQIPIFRFRDGFSQMKKNIDSFDRVYEELHNGARVIIFCEGMMKWEKKLHPIQKGAARMAVGAWEKDHDCDVHIVPLGVNYENHCKMQRRVDVSIGNPIRIKDYEALLQTDKRKAINKLTKELQKNLQPQIIDVKTEEHYDLGDKITQMYWNKEKRKLNFVKTNRPEVFDPAVKVAAQTKILDEDKTVQSAMQAYANTLGEQFLEKDYSIKHANSFSFSHSLLFYLIIVPLGIVGIVANALPMMLTEYISSTRTSKAEFYASVKPAVGLFAYLFYVILWFFMWAIFFNWSIAAWSLLGLFGFGYFGLILWDRMPFRAAYHKLGISSKDELEKLKVKRASVVQNFNELS